jgi:predicted nucleic acid-binding protein
MRLDDWPGSSFGNGLLIDSNLLVLFTVGTVNPARIPIFKRTSSYDRDAFELLVRVMNRFERIYTVAHVMAEVSNLTDLNGQERLHARRILAATVTLFQEPHVPSRQAAAGSPYEDLGLADSAISIVAREKKCTVLTDDLSLYLSLMGEKLPAVNFTHLRQLNWQR